jgi:nicotinamide-nucleotide amidase
MLLKNVNAEIITIGDEILIGQIIDTNSAWMARELNLLGINVYQITSISDNNEHIINSLEQAASRADIILVTGGLGPTKDDITKQTIAGYFGATLVQNKEVLQHIYNLLQPRGIKINELNIRQADVPDNCQIIFNSCGTAPGMWFDRNGKVYVFMPGVPFEMTNMMTHEVLPRLKKYFETPAIVHKTLMLYGIAESALAQLIEPWELQLPEYIKLAYLPSMGMLKLRLTAKGENYNFLSSLIEQEVGKLLPVINGWHYGYDDELLEVTIGKLLKNNNKTISTAESCTGGKIASFITSVPGSSSYFKGAIVAYANEIKTSLLNVPSELINEKGAVSQQVVESMAANACQILGSDYSIATSGIAGPDGGTPEKPVGTVWIAVASKHKVIARKYFFSDNNRDRNIQRSSLSAMNELRKLIIEELEEK